VDTRPVSIRHGARAACTPLALTACRPFREDRRPRTRFPGKLPLLRQRSQPTPSLSVRTPVRLSGGVLPAACWCRRATGQIGLHGAASIATMNQTPRKAPTRVAMVRTGFYQDTLAVEPPPRQRSGRSESHVVLRKANPTEPARILRLQVSPSQRLLSQPHTYAVAAMIEIASMGTSARRDAAASHRRGRSWPASG